MNKGKPLPTVRELCDGVSPDSAIEHLIVCPVCGQMFDCRDRAAVEHHSEALHEAKLK